METNEQFNKVQHKFFPAHTSEDEQNRDPGTLFLQFPDSETGEVYNAYKRSDGYYQTSSNPEYNEQRVAFRICTLDNQQVGKVEGLLTNRENNQPFFESDDISNTAWDIGTKPQKPDPNYKHRVVGKFITYAIISNTIGTWRSAASLTQQGRETYNGYLRKNPLLDVKEIPSPNVPGMTCFLIQMNPQR